MFENHQRNTNPPSRKGGNDRREGTRERKGQNTERNYIYYNAGANWGHQLVQCWLEI